VRDDDVNRAVKAYLETADDATAARLRFLEGLWDMQHEIEANAPLAVPPDASAAERALALGRPLFSVMEPEVPAEDYRAAVDRIATHVADNAGLEPEQCGALREIDLAVALPDHRIAGAACDSGAFVAQVSEALRAQSEGAISNATAAFVLLSALTPFLTRASAAALASLGDSRQETRGSRACPVCGSPPSLGRITQSADAGAGERRLWCPLCRAEWGFDRLRCVRCGTRAAAKLHYTHEERDPAHRVHLCDECHGYLKVVVEDELDKPPSMVVEEAVSIALDAIASAQGYTPAGDGGQSAASSRSDRPE
jgi:FdhE protein